MVKTPRKAEDTSLSHNENLGPDSAVGSFMTDEEWKTVSTLRVFRIEDMRRARMAIDSLMFAFRYLQLDRERIPEFRARLEALAKDVERFDGHLVDLMIYSAKRDFPIGSKGITVKHPHRALLDDEQIKKIRVAVRLLRRRIASGLSLLSAGTSGPATEDVYYLVERLNEIVMKHSDGKSLTRSSKNWSDKGNDLDFVTTIVGIALKGTGRVVGNGTIVGAIKQLKKVEREAEQPEVMSVEFEIPDDKSQPEENLVVALQAVRQIRKRQ